MTAAFENEVVTEAHVRFLRVPGLAGELALITLDNGHDHTRPSTFGPGGIASLDAALDEIAAHTPAPAVIAVTGKPFIFAVGADLSGSSGQHVGVRALEHGVDLLLQPAGPRGVPHHRDQHDLQQPADGERRVTDQHAAEREEHFVEADGPEAEHPHVKLPVLQQLGDHPRAQPAAAAGDVDDDAVDRDVRAAARAFAAGPGTPGQSVAKIHLRDSRPRSKRL